MSEYDCPPVRLPNKDGVPALASRVSVLADRYRSLMDDRADYRTLVREGAALARAAQRLTTAITDAINESPDNRVIRVDIDE